MMINCPNCGHFGEQNSAPIRGPANDGSELWICASCPALVCSFPVSLGNDKTIPCYVKHTSEAHPEAYQPHKKPTASGKKNKKHKK